MTPHGPRWLLRAPTGAATWHASKEAAMKGMRGMRG